MKFIKKLLPICFALIIAFVFSSCFSEKIEVNTEQNSDNYVENEDYQNYLYVLSSFAKADGGYYFVTDSLLYFYDTVGKEAYPVCSKANCSHSDSGCEAYLSITQFYPGAGIYYYDDALYLLGHEDDSAVQHIYMYRISLENYKHQKAAYLFDTNGISILCILHRGYVYFTNDGGEMEETSATLCRVRLGDTSGDTLETVYTFKGIGASVAGLSAYGNNVFFTTSSYADTEGNGYETMLNYINIHTLESNTIPERKYSHFAAAGRVYYCSDENTVSYYDITSHENIFFCNVDGPCYISADSSYVYLDNLQSIIVGKTDESDRKIFVYDKDGNYITEIVPKNPDDDCYFGGDDIMIFYEASTDEIVMADGAKGFYVLDKSQLTSGNMQFIDME